MDFSNPTLFHAGLLIALPVLVMALLNWLLRGRGGLAPGWTGAVFIALCWITALTIIVMRLRA